MADATAAIDMHPMFINLEKAYPVLEGYPEAELDLKVFACIAGDANSRGVSFPTIKTMAEKLGETAKRVWYSVQRLIAKGLIKVLRKEKKYQDRHPRNIYQIVKVLLRTEPDTGSSHFDAEKWKTIAARLKKFVSDAVDDMKQVVTGFAQNMARKPKKQRKQRQNRAWNQQDYRRNSWKQSYQEPVLSPEERQRRDWINRLCQQGRDDLEKADMTPDGVWMANRYLTDHVRKTPEKYDSILHDAINKFKDFQNLNCWETRVQLGLDPLGMYKGHSSSPVSEARMMSHDDEPMTLGGILGAAFA